MAIVSARNFRHGRKGFAWMMIAISIVSILLLSPSSSHDRSPSSLSFLLYVNGEGDNRNGSDVESGARTSALSSSQAEANEIRSDESSEKKDNKIAKEIVNDTAKALVGAAVDAATDKAKHTVGVDGILPIVSFVSLHSPRANKLPTVSSAATMRSTETENYRNERAKKMEEGSAIFLSRNRENKFKAHEDSRLIGNSFIQNRIKTDSALNGGVSRYVVKEGESEDEDEEMTDTDEQRIKRCEGEEIMRRYLETMQKVEFEDTTAWGVVLQNMKMTMENPELCMTLEKGAIINVCKKPEDPALTQDDDMDEDKQKEGTKKESDTKEDKDVNKKDSKADAKDGNSSGGGKEGKDNVGNKFRCGGDNFKHTISQFAQGRNCMLNLAFSHVLVSNWLGTYKNHRTDDEGSSSKGQGEDVDIYQSREVPASTELFMTSPSNPSEGPQQQSSTKSNGHSTEPSNQENKVEKKVPDSSNDGKGKVADDGPGNSGNDGDGKKESGASDEEKYKAYMAQYKKKMRRYGLLAILRKSLKIVIDNYKAIPAFDVELYNIYSDSLRLVEEFEAILRAGLREFNSGCLSEVILQRRAEQLSLLCAYGTSHPISSANRMNVEKSINVNEATDVSGETLILKVNGGGRIEAAVTCFKSIISKFTQVFIVPFTSVILIEAIDIQKKFQRFRSRKIAELMETIDTSVKVPKRTTGTFSSVPHNRNTKKKAEDLQREQTSQNSSFIQQKIEEQPPNSQGKVSGNFKDQNGSGTGSSNKKEGGNESDGEGNGNKGGSSGGERGSGGNAGGDNDAGDNAGGNGVKGDGISGGETGVNGGVNNEGSGVEGGGNGKYESNCKALSCDRVNEFSPRHDDNEEFSVDIQSKVRRIFSRLSYFKIQKRSQMLHDDASQSGADTNNSKSKSDRKEPPEPYDYPIDEEQVEKIVRSGYFDMSDKIFTIWGGILPQAALESATQYFFLMMPNPAWDLPEFYGKKIDHDGKIVDTEDGKLFDNKRVAVQFSEYIVAMYRDIWNLFFKQSDNFLSGAQFVRLKKQETEHSFLTVSEGSPNVLLVEDQNGLDMGRMTAEFVDKQVVDKMTNRAMQGNSFSRSPFLTLAIVCLTASYFIYL